MNRLVTIVMHPVDATLELRSKESSLDNSKKGLITIRLSTSDPVQTGALAVSNARQDIERSGILKLAANANSEHAQVLGAAIDTTGRLATALAIILSKLDVFIDIIDKTSKVSI